MLNVKVSIDIKISVFVEGKYCGYMGEGSGKKS